MRSVFPDQLPGGFVLGVERVQGYPASGQVQLAEKRARHRDFIGFGVHQRAAQIELAGHGDGAQDGVAGAVAVTTGLAAGEVVVIPVGGPAAMLRDGQRISAR